jgi:hypothetical protein
MPRGIVLALLVAACAPPSAGPAASPTPHQTPTPSAHTAAPITFSVEAPQARFVATVIGFVDAFNAGDVQTASGFLAENVVGGDCDYGRGLLIEFRNRTEALVWLRGRAADHDRMAIGRIFNENPEPASGSRVVGIEWAGRQSDTLGSGMGPHGTAKVVFSDDGRQIVAFANGAAPCKP